MPEYRSASGSAAEDLFIDLFADIFGAEKAGYSNTLEMQYQLLIPTLLTLIFLFLRIQILLHLKMD